MRTRVKICGITRQEDLRSAVDAGADAVGFVFHPTSKRFVSAQQAAGLVCHLPAFVSSVALFVNPEHSAVQDVLHLMRPSLLQFHGEEMPEFCESFDTPYIKAFRVGAPGLDSPQALIDSCKGFMSARAWLFDSFTPAYGGSGHGFDHSLLTALARIDPTQRRPLILSGGLNPNNLLEPLQSLRPWAVDVSSGVEVGPGVKSAQLIKDFMFSIKNADIHTDD